MMQNHTVDFKKVYVLSLFSRIVAKLKKTPSFLALAIQFIALFFVLVFSRSIYASASAQWHMDASFFIFSLVILQSIIASALSYALGMAIWWRWIHLFFPLALWAMAISQISNTFYLIGFVITLTLYWTTFKTQVPFYPSRPAVWKALAQLMTEQFKPAMRMIDIGSGIGDLSMYIAKNRKLDQVEGIEIAPLPWIISLLRAKLKRSSAQFILGNYQNLDFANYDVVFAYLSPAAMPELWQKASKEMGSGSLLVSLEFDIPDANCTKVIETGKSSPKLYVWRM
ncbi:MAG: class I SAM-dependent methyltransferase [Methylophilus sp.]|jgi:hypothetical protein